MVANGSRSFTKNNIWIYKKDIDEPFYARVGWFVKASNNVTWCNGLVEEIKETPNKINGTGDQEIEIDGNMQQNTKSGGDWKEKNKKKQVPKVILNVKKTWIKYDGSKFHTSTLEMVAGRLEAHILKNLMMKYKEYEKEKSFVLAGMEYKMREHMQALFRLRIIYWKA